MTIPIPGSRYEPEEESYAETLRKEIVRLRRALRALPRYEGTGDAHPRGIFVRWDDMDDAIRGEK